MFTVVTGFFDIGREKWGNMYNRKLEDYMNHFKNLLSLKVNMVIFVEDTNIEFVKSVRVDVDKSTKIISKKFEELYMFKYLYRIEEIQKNPEYSKGHPNPIAPEISEPLYNIVTCSKMSLVKEATIYDKESEFFIWLDAGYTHGTMDLSKLEWNPTRLFTSNDKMSFIALQNMDLAKDDPREFFLQYIDILIGGFFSGHRNVIKKVNDLYYNLVEEMLEKGIKDDDQFYNTVLYKRHSDLFEILFGTWYSAMSIT